MRSATMRRMAVSSIGFPATTGAAEGAGGGNGATERAAHLDIEVDENLAGSVVIRRAAIFLGWLVAFLISTSLIGMLPTIFLFVVSFMRMENREPWRLVAISSIGLTGFSWFLFEYLLALPWPRSQLGIWLPWFAENIPSM